MNPFEFSIPQNIIVGAGTLAKLPECAKKMGGTHAMILSGPTLKKMGVVDKAADSLKAAGIAADIFTDIEANPSVTTVEKATESYLASGADFLVALGGGSPMDVAKAVGVTAKYGGSITEYEGAHKVPGKIVPLIAIPTTAGTGSEVTAFSVITDHSRDYKLTVFSYELLPEYAILDPELLTSAPASVAAACGIDAFIHAEEAYISTAASPFSDAMAEKAMELIGKNIRRFVARRTDLDIRVEIVTMKTTGDRILDRSLEQIGGKGLFVKELDQALRKGRVDLSVHSLKDMPMDIPEDLPILAYSKREDPRDVLIFRQGQTESISGGMIGTSSKRRRLQLERLYPDCHFQGIRGNVQTRLRKLEEEGFCATVLAAAGLKRLGMDYICFG